MFGFLGGIWLFHLGMSFLGGPLGLMTLWTRQISLPRDVFVLRSLAIVLGICESSFKSFCICDGCTGRRSFLLVLRKECRNGKAHGNSGASGVCRGYNENSFSTPYNQLATVEQVPVLATPHKLGLRKLHSAGFHKLGSQYTMVLILRAPDRVL